MNIKYLIIFVLFISINNSYGQQNLFNIPSGDITNNKRFFYQHQLNLYSDKVESKAHLVYGLGKGWDVGLNLVGKGVYFSPNWRILHNDNPERGALYPILMGTAQKQFDLSKNFKINLGVQAGPNLSSKIKNKELNYLTYGIGVYQFMKGKSRLVGGVYKTNEMFVGGGNTSGIMAGYEIKISKRAYLMGDWVSGTNDASVSVLGGMYNVTKRMQVCLGWQIPNPNTLKANGLVIEINLLGWDLY